MISIGWILHVGIKIVHYHYQSRQATAHNIVYVRRGMEVLIDVKKLVGSKQRKRKKKAT